MVTSLVLVAVVAAAASQQTGSISGVITDTIGHSLPGATLTARSENGAVRRTATDLNGRYQFAGLPPGRYRVEASMSGFEARATDLTVVPARDAAWSGALLVGPPLGATSIERHVMGITGSNARDCGRHGSAASEAALQRSLRCGLTSAGAREPFSVIVQSAGGKSHAGFGLLSGPDGTVHVFRYKKGGVWFRSQPCPPSQLTLRPHGSGPRYEFACQP